MAETIMDDIVVRTKPVRLNDSSAEQSPGEKLVPSIDMVLRTDTITSSCVNDKFLLIGTAMGHIYLLDYSGLIISKLQSGSSNICCLSTDSAIEVIGCSCDDRVLVYSLEPKSILIKLTLDKPVRCMAIDPAFSTLKSGRCIIGYRDQVLLYTKVNKFIGGVELNKKVLSEGNGLVSKLEWKCNIVIWACDKGVIIYDISESRMIGIVEKQTTLPPELFPYFFHWLTESKIVVGYGNMIQVIAINKWDVADSKSSRRYTDCIDRISLDGKSICGIGSVFDNTIFCLLYDSIDEDKVDPAVGPCLVMYTLATVDKPRRKFDIERLEIGPSYQNMQPRHFDIKCVPGDDKISFIQTPKELFITKFYSPHSGDISTEYFEHVLQKDIKKAMELLPKYCRKSDANWENALLRLSQLNQLILVTDLVPVKVEANGPKLLKAYWYDKILEEVLVAGMVEKFEQLLDTWPRALYSPNKVQSVIQTLLQKSSADAGNATRRTQMILCQAKLYEMTGFQDRAVEVLLRSGQSKIFDLIKRYNSDIDKLGEMLSDRVFELFLCDENMALQLITENKRLSHLFKSNQVVHQLQADARAERFLYLYLDSLFSNRQLPAQSHNELLIQLYAKYDRSKLLPFLRSSKNYRLEVASEFCDRNRLIPELVELYGEGGKSERALELIVTDLKDIHHAVKFCQRKGDDRLWLRLIDYAMRKPAYIAALLKTVQTNIDPLRIVERIPSQMTIPGLRDSIVTILRDCQLQTRLTRTSLRALHDDLDNVFTGLERASRRGYVFSQQSPCASCQLPLELGDSGHHSAMVDDNGSGAWSTAVVQYWCGHSFHSTCVSGQLHESATIPTQRKCNICVSADDTVKSLMKMTKRRSTVFLFVLQHDKAGGDHGEWRLGMSSEQSAVKVVESSLSRWLKRFRIQRKVSMAKTALLDRPPTENALRLVESSTKPSGVAVSLDEFISMSSPSRSDIGTALSTLATPQRKLTSVEAGSNYFDGARHLESFVSMRKSRKQRPAPPPPSLPKRQSSLVMTPEEMAARDERQLKATDSLASKLIAALRAPELKRQTDGAVQEEPLSEMDGSLLSWDDARRYVMVVLETLATASANGDESMSSGWSEDAARRSLQPNGDMTLSPTISTTSSLPNTTTGCCSACCVNLASICASLDDAGSGVVLRLPMTDVDVSDESRLVESRDELALACDPTKNQTLLEEYTSDSLVHLLMSTRALLITARRDVAANGCAGDHFSMVDSCVTLFQTDTRPEVRLALCHLLQTCCSLHPCNVLAMLLDSSLPHELFRTFEFLYNDENGGAAKSVMSLSTSQLDLLLNVYASGNQVPVTHFEAFLNNVPSLLLDMLDAVYHRMKRDDQFRASLTDKRPCHRLMDRLLHLFLAVTLQYSNDSVDVDFVRSPIAARDAEVSCFIDRFLVLFNDAIDPLSQYRYISEDDANLDNSVEHLARIIFNDEACCRIFGHNDREILMDVFIRTISTTDNAAVLHNFKELMLTFLNNISEDARNATLSYKSAELKNIADEFDIELLTRMLKSLPV